MSQGSEKENLSSEDFKRRIREREPQAIEVVVHSYTEHLYRASLGLGFDQIAARDLVQSVWTTFFDVAERFEGKSHVRTFIFGILYNKASEMRREQLKSESNDPIEEVLEARFDTHGNWATPPISPEKFMLAAETLTLIEKCLENLPLSQRMAFSLKEIDEHGNSDICKILNVTATNLGVLLFRAKNRLRECIEGKAKKRA